MRMHDLGRAARVRSCPVVPLGCTDVSRPRDRRRPAASAAVGDSQPPPPVESERSPFSWRRKGCLRTNGRAPCPSRSTIFIGCGGRRCLSQKPSPNGPGIPRLSRLSRARGAGRGDRQHLSERFGAPGCSRVSSCHSRPAGQFAPFAPLTSSMSPPQPRGTLDRWSDRGSSTPAGFSISRPPLRPPATPSPHASARPAIKTRRR
jgi:hypothetical protein